MSRLRRENKSRRDAEKDLAAPRDSKLGMSASHKEKFRRMMDLFMFNNDGCLLCTERIKEFYYDTTHKENHPVVVLYGLCNDCEGNMYQLRKMIDMKLEAWSKDKELQVDISASDPTPASFIEIKRKPRVVVCNFIK
jgi:hypothetical protein